MVQYTDVAEEEGAWGMLEGRSMPSWKFSDEVPAGSGNYVPKQPGFSLTGVLKEMPQQRQAMDFTTKQPKFYTDGKPIMEIVLTMDTNERLDADDDGSRRWYLNGHARRALQDEMKRLGIKRFGIGTVITATIAGFKPNPKGRASMIFDVKLQPTEYVAPQQMGVEQTLAQAGFQPAQEQWHQPQQMQPQQPYQAAQQQYAQQQLGVPPVQQFVQPQVQQEAAGQQFAQQQYQQQLAQQQAQQFQAQMAPQPPAQQFQQPQEQPFQAMAQQFQQAQEPQQVQQFQQAPQPPAVTVFAPQNGQLMAQPAGTPTAAPQGGGMVVTGEHVDQVKLLMQSGGINRQTAIQAVADSVAPGNAEYLGLLDSNIPA